MFRTVAEYILTFGRVPRQPRIISRSVYDCDPLHVLNTEPHTVQDLPPDQHPYLSNLDSMKLIRIFLITL